MTRLTIRSYLVFGQVILLPLRNGRVIRIGLVAAALHKAHTDFIRLYLTGPLEM